MLRWLGLVILVVAGAVSGRVLQVTRLIAAPSAVSCAGLELRLAPGLHPSSPSYPFHTAPDAPRTPFTVALPIYPGLMPLPKFAGSPFAEVQESPYLQTASGEFHTTASSDTVQAWSEQAMHGCGWRDNGSWNGNAGAFPHGISFTRGPTGAFSTYIDIGFADESDGSTDVAITAEAARYPAPPAAARIHGPFVQVRIALSRSSRDNLGAARTIHAVVTNRRVIDRLVGAIDDIGAAFTVPTVCFGGLHTTGPAWLTFVRADGSWVHAFEAGAGVCGGGLAVNGFRWLLDPGTVWSNILSLTKGRATLAAPSSGGITTSRIFPCPTSVTPDVAQVTRANVFGNDRSRFPSFHRVVLVPAQVRELFQATCRLRPVVGPYSCPADVGIVYHLTFERRGRTILRVVANASGCSWLYRGDRLRSGQAYWVWFGPKLSKLSWMPAARWWALSLGRMLGVPIGALSPSGG